MFSSNFLSLSCCVTLLCTAMVISAYAAAEEKAPTQAEIQKVDEEFARIAAKDPKLQASLKELHEAEAHLDETVKKLNERVAADTKYQAEEDEKLNARIEAMRKTDPDFLKKKDDASATTGASADGRKTK